MTPIIVIIAFRQDKNKVNKLTFCAKQSIIFQFLGYKEMQQILHTFNKC